MTISAILSNSAFVREKGLCNHRAAERLITFD